MLIADRLSHLLMRIANSEESTLMTVAFILKSLASIFAFLVVVIIWDTLPSISPIGNREVVVFQHTHYERPDIDIVENYDIVRSVEFEISRRLVHKETLDIILVPTSRGSYQTGHKSELFEVPIDYASKGRWCLESTLSWVNGLSLRPHKQLLPQHCIEVQ